MNGKNVYIQYSIYRIRIKIIYIYNIKIIAHSLYIVHES